MTKPITIPKALPQDSALSYDFLREEGIRHIQQMAGDTWTDHNTHDPGITILEQLCYAITDLAYRMDYDMKDLLGRDGAGSYKDLYGPAAILTVNPVTLLDLRKIVIDVEGVKNAWVEKVSRDDFGGTAGDDNPAAITPKGLYRVLIEKDGLVEAKTDPLLMVKTRLQACRGVCEDFEEFRPLDPQYIRLQGIIEIADTVDDVNQLVAGILLRVDAHLSPRIPFYTLKQLLEQGKRMEEIFDGPTLDHGFIDDDELLRHTRKREIHTSDVIREIMDVEGVLAVDEFAIATGTGTGTVKEWLLSLDPAKTPKLDVRNMKEALKKLEFTAQGLKAGIDPDRVKALYDEKSKASLSGGKLRPEARDILLPETRDRNLSNYYSIQDQFPANYGIGITGLPDSAPEKRKAQARQLTAYLALFEQLLANYFSQLDHFKDLVSFDGEDRRTYFNQSLLDSVSGLEEVLESTESYLQYLEERTSDSGTGLKRKNRFLDHLLARFGEKFTGYGMLLQNPSDNTNASNDKYYEVEKKLITDKSNFLRDYPLVSAGRAKAYNYTKEEYWQSDNISGLEKRIARKLGVEDYSRRNLGDGDTEGFHMVEHILLRTHAKELYPFRARYTSGNITAFEDPEITGFTRCASPGHPLEEGESIRIQGPEHYDGEYTVHSVEEDSFEIEVAFQTSVDGATWTRTQPDVHAHYTPGEVSAFEDPENTGFTRCVSPGHTLRTGEEIHIQGPEHYEGLHTVHAVADDHFEIEIDFQASAGGAVWQRTQPDIRYLILTEPVTAFSEGAQEEHSFCQVNGHSLQEGDRVEIAGTQHYDGTYSITEITENGFEIPVAFVENETTGRWMQVDVSTDPYSLQLTFVLPGWMERYQNDQLKRFVENTIREETPVHLTVYIKWFDQPGMQRFDQAFYRFLSEINNR